MQDSTLMYFIIFSDIFHYKYFRVESYAHHTLTHIYMHVCALCTMQR